MGTSFTEGRTPREISAGRLKLRIDPDRGGALEGLWYDLDGDGAFSDDEKILDTGPGQGLLLEVVEIPGEVPTISSSEWVAGRTPGPMESWYQGEPYRLATLADSVERDGPNRLVVSGRFLWAGIWPYRLAWEITQAGAVLGEFQLLDGGKEPRPSEVLALGLDLRFRYRSHEGFRRRAVHAGVDRRIWELPAEVVRWWQGIKGYTSRSERYGFSHGAEVPWPDFNLVTLVQNGANDCRLWKAAARDAGNLTHWRGVKSRGWMHVEDRSWGLGYGIADMANHAPGSLSADLDSGDLSASISIRSWPRQAHRLDPRGPDGDKLTLPHRFFFAPNLGRWDEGMAGSLDCLGSQSGGIDDAEPDPEKVMFTKPRDLPPVPKSEDAAVFRIDEPAGVDRHNWPVTAGVPLRPGESASVDEFCLQGPDGSPLPCQTEALAYWPDRSIKWLLVDAQVDLPAGKGEVFSLKKGARGPQPAAKVKAYETATGVRVETSALAFEVDRDGSGFIDRAWLDPNQDGRFEDREMVVGGSGGRRSMLDFVRSDTYATGDHDIRGTLDESRVRIEELKIERSGPLRAVVLVRGRYCNRVESPFTLRLEAYAEKPWIRAQHTFTYAMDPQGEFLKAAGLSLPLTMDGERRITFSGAAAPLSPDEGISRSGMVQESLRRAVVWGCERSSGVVQERRQSPVSAPVVLQEGERARGWADISNSTWGLTVAVQNFWQEFAKGISVDRERGEITAWFWPPEAPPLDLRRYSRWMYPQVGETTYPWGSGGDWRNVGYAAGLAKTSTAVFAFHIGAVQPEEAEKLAKGFQDRPVAICNPSHYAEVGVAGGFAAYHDESYPILERTLTDICDWFIFSRERFSWYGMIDYGDIGHTWRPPIQYDDDGPYLLRDGWAYDIGRWGWTNTEGQDALGYLMCFFHTGRRAYFDAGAITARHNQDVDIFQWGPRKYQGHTRHNVNHWGDGDFEIRISQPSPNRFYYYLTGDPRSRDIIEGVVDEVYANYTLTQSADLGAVLYGFLVRWEMTGDPVWRDRALAICHAYRDCMLPDGCIAHKGYAIEAATGRNLRKAEAAGNVHDLMFSHGFGAIHAMIELHQLTDDEGLWDMLYRHAVFCATAEPQVSSYLLLLAYALERTGERRFADRLLANLARRGFLRGVYPRDRRYWTGVWEQSDARSGERMPVRTVNTAGTGFDWSPMPVVLRALAVQGIREREIPG
jgi:hypothetical protein